MDIAVGAIDLELDADIAIILILKRSECVPSSLKTASDSGVRQKRPHSARMRWAVTAWYQLERTDQDLDLGFHELRFQRAARRQKTLGECRRSERHTPSPYPPWSTSNSLLRPVSGLS